jgi:hypothetical protein
VVGEDEGDVQGVTELEEGSVDGSDLSGRVLLDAPEELLNAVA